MSSRFAISAISLAAFLGAATPPPPTAIQEFTNLNRQADAARKAGSHQLFLSLALQMRDLLNDSPPSLEAVAQAYIAAGDPTHALATLHEFANLGETDEQLLRGADPHFASLAKLPEYQSILKQLAQNNTPLSGAREAFTLPDPGLLPEDIDFDPRSKTFLISSVLKKKIIRVAFNGAATDFAKSPRNWPVLALKVDSLRGLVWATEVSLDGFAIAPQADWGKSAVLCFDLSSGKLLRRLEAPHTSLGDLALLPNGDPLVSDGDGGGLYRVTNGSLEQIDNRNFISPQTPAVSSDGRHVFVPDYVRGIGILDLQTKEVEWMNRGSGIKSALNGIDGLYFDRGALILTQNGTSPERVVRMRLNQTLNRTESPTHTAQIVSEDIIERSTPTLGDPTHGVVNGDWFYYIANSGWNVLDEHGNIKPRMQLTPARVMRFALR